jgi:hypothetical protein
MRLIDTKSIHSAFSIAAWGVYQLNESRNQRQGEIFSANVCGWQMCVRMYRELVVVHQ